MSKLVSIWVSESTNKRFDDLGGRQDSDDDILSMLINEYERMHPR